MIGYTVGKFYDKTLGRIVPLPIFLLDSISLLFWFLHSKIAGIASKLSGGSVPLILKPFAKVLSIPFRALSTLTGFAKILLVVAIAITIFFIVMKLVKLITKLVGKRGHRKRMRRPSRDEMGVLRAPNDDAFSAAEDIAKTGAGDLDRLDSFR